MICCNIIINSTTPTRVNRATPPCPTASFPPELVVGLANVNKLIFLHGF